MTRTVWATFRTPGIHFWPEATNYLREPHRHLFHFRVEISVTHGDREIEFIDLGELLSMWVNEQVLEFGYDAVPLSCEQMAEMIIEHLVEVYGDRDYKVEVSEDGENGATVSRLCCTCR